MRRKNFLDGLLKVYKRQVKKCDKSGFADTLKECTDRIFKDLNNCFALEENNVHFEDVQFLDGYFIFGTGTNSVVNFKIKECPGWLFGIWWDVPSESKSNYAFIDGELFAQYEETIDKFKPSASHFCENISAPKDDERECLCFHAANMIAFIRDEPCLAFCRDYNGWDYNEEYHTREEAENAYKEYIAWRENEAKYTEECDNRVLSFVKEKIIPLFADAEIYDCGDGWSPRYDVIAPLNKNKDIVHIEGCYSWFDDDDDIGAGIMSEYNAILEKCDEIADKYKFCWYSPVDPVIEFYK